MLAGPLQPAFFPPLSVLCAILPSCQACPLADLLCVLRPSLDISSVCDHSTCVCVCACVCVHVPPSPRKYNPALGTTVGRLAVAGCGVNTQVLDTCSRELELEGEACMLFTLEGIAVRSLDAIKDNMSLVVSTGEKFDVCTASGVKAAAPEENGGSRPRASTSFNSKDKDDGFGGALAASINNEDSLRNFRRSSVTASARRVNLLDNKDPGAAPVKVTIPIKFFDIMQLVDLATEAMKLKKANRAAKQLFTTDGKLIKDLSQVDTGMDLVVSCGEAFDFGHGGSGRPLSASQARYMTTPQRKVTVWLNGKYKKEDGKPVVMHYSLFQMRQFLDQVQEDLKMSTIAQALYTVGDNIKLTDLNQVQNGMNLVVVGPEKLDPATGTGKAPSHQDVIPVTMRNEEGNVMRHYKNMQKRITVFLNGDYMDTAGQAVVIPHNHYVMDQVLDFLQVEMRLNELVNAKQARKLFTMDGRLVSDVDQIENGKAYVVSGGEKFLKGTGTGQMPTEDPFAADLAALENMRHMQISQKRINVWINGDLADRTGKTVVVPLKYWHINQLIDHLDEELKMKELTKVATALYDKETGVQITDMNQVRNGSNYIITGGPGDKLNMDTGSGKKKPQTLAVDRSPNMYLDGPSSVGGGTIRHMVYSQRKVTVFINGDIGDTQGKSIIIPHNFFHIKQLIDLIDEELKMASLYKVATELFDRNTKVHLTDVTMIHGGEQLVITGAPGEKLDTLTGTGKFPQKEFNPSDFEEVALPEFMAAAQRTITAIYEGVPSLNVKPRVKKIVVPRNFINISQLIDLVQTELKLDKDGKAVLRLRDSKGKALTEMSEVVDGAKLIADTGKK
eukprot:jgi/Mesvir1/4503/Mv03782-RA.2